MSNKKGLLFLLVGPSGVGKKTIWQPIIKDPRLNICFSISMTTRPMRPGEIEGVDYFFKTKEQFELAIKNNELLEYATYANNYYGTPKAFVEKLRNEGKNVMLEIEGQGALFVIDLCKKCQDDGLVSIFIKPESLEDLRNRLKNRSTECDEVIEKRIKQSEWELTQINKFKYVICNRTGQSEQATKELFNIFATELKNRGLWKE
ncbi:MAG: guanylate kinase [Mycoplasma sp.]